MSVKYAGKKHIYAGKSDDGFATLLVEDSKAGFQFYRRYMGGKAAVCVSAGSNTAIFPYLTNHKTSSTFVIADGAAFGAEMNRIFELIRHAPGNIILCLPESFEWLILKSGLVHADRLEAVLSQPSTYIDSSKFMNWEQFFADYLIGVSNNTPYQYQKSHINPYFLIPANMEKIIREIDLPDSEKS